MKKFLVVLLSAMMVFAFATTAFAAGQFTDIADLSKEGQDAISKLSALEIIGGYPDGTFKPSATITRAEFAKMACVAGGMSESADILGGTTSQFSDVKANEWYTGYINLAVSQGYVKGYPDGTFKPNNTITNAEVITVIMRILGYNDNLPGPWPVDYVAKAGNLEITTGIVTSTNANAVRGDVARMIDNALEENVVVWNNDIDDFDDKYQNRETTLLSDSFKGQTREDLTVVDWSVDSFTKGNLRLTFVDEDNKQVGFVVTDATVIGGGNSVYDINNMQADVIFKHDKDLDKDVVKYVDIKSSKVEATKVAADGATKVRVGDKTYTSVRNVEIPAGKNTFFTAYVDEDNIVYLIENDQDADSDSYVVDEYLAASERINTYGKQTIALKGDDVMIFDQAGKAIQASDLKEKDIIKVYENKGDADKVIFVEDWAEGTLNNQNGNKLGIDGVDYLNTGATYFDDDEDSSSFDDDFLGTKVQYALDAENVVIGVIYTETGLGNTVYGIVTAIAADRSFTQENRETMYYNTITLFNGDGKTVKYNVEDLEIGYINDKADVDFTNGTSDKYDGNVNEGTAAFLKAGDLVRVRLTKEGEIHRVWAPGAKPADDEKDGGATVLTGKQDLDVDARNERISLGNSAYPVLAKLAAFDVTMDNGVNTIKVDTVSMITKEQLISGDLKGENVQYITNDGDLVAIAVEDYASSGNAHFGFIKTAGLKTSSIDYGIRFYGDSKIYEVTAAQNALVEDALADLAAENKANGTDKDEALFVRYELSGDKVTIVENVDDGDAIAANLASIDLAKVDAVSSVKNGVYTAGEVEFTIEDNTSIYEITYDKDGAIYDIKAVSSVGKSDTVSVQTRGNNIASSAKYDEQVGAGLVEASLDNFERLQAEFVVIYNVASNADKDSNDSTSKNLKELAAGADKDAVYVNYSAKNDTVTLMIGEGDKARNVEFDASSITVIAQTGTGDDATFAKKTIDYLTTDDVVTYGTKNGAVNVIVVPAK